MTRFLFLAFACCLTVFEMTAQTDEVGSGHALQLDGIDDYVDLGNIYDNLQFPITISAWVFVDENTFNWAPVFVSQDNAPVYNGFWFLIQPTIIAIGYGDGLGENDPAFRRGKSATFSSIANRWVHIAGIIRGATDMDLFVNGINVGGSYSGFSDSPMSSTNTDVAKIGYWYSNSQVTHFKGKLDEVRIWNRALTAEQIRNSMCRKIAGNDLALIGYWNFNELSGGVLIDKSPNHFNGVLKNNPLHTFSGAPMGDASIYKYPLNNGDVLSMKDGDNQISVKNSKGLPEGMQIYQVNELPSQTTGLNTNTISAPYFGVFVASLDNDNSFDVDYNFQNSPPCTIFKRVDNSVSIWSEIQTPVKDVTQRGEFIKIPGQKAAVQLGEDKIVCDLTSVTLTTDVSDPNFKYKWSTGSTSPEITVIKPGVYWLTVSGQCNVTSDTVRVQILKTPADFSLGEDRNQCPIVIQRIQPYDAVTDGIEFTWQDGSKKPYFDITGYGEYSVTAKNVCGEAADSIVFSKSDEVEKEIPNVITPNGDVHNQFFYWDPDKFGEVSLLIVNRWGNRVFYSSKYKNNWDGDELTPGVYFYTAQGECLTETKGSISVIR